MRHYIRDNTATLSAPVKKLVWQKINESIDEYEPGTFDNEITISITKFTFDIIKTNDKPDITITKVSHIELNHES